MMMVVCTTTTLQELFKGRLSIDNPFLLPSCLSQHRLPLPSRFLFPSIVGCWRKGFGSAPPLQSIGSSDPCLHESLYLVTSLPHVYISGLSPFFCSQIDEVPLKLLRLLIVLVLIYSNDPPFFDLFSPFCIPHLESPTSFILQTYPCNRAFLHAHLKSSTISGSNF